MSDPGIDGRRLRSDRSRAAVVDALLTLYEEGNAQPGAAEIARRAGVSERSVFRHFEDLDSLAVATIEIELQRIGDLFTLPDGDTLDARVRALVDQRVALYSATGAVARAALLLVPRSGVVANAVRYRRDVLWRQVGALFAAELEPLPKRDREEIVDAIDVLCSIEGIELLAATDRHTPARTRRMLIRAVTAVLDTRDTGDPGANA
ncbi:MAG TPA: TetR/AcrR family transcriptional regulator [Acidimicrobiia bacterium]|jgi:AcrR family transcriptional regulator